VVAPSNDGENNKGTGELNLGLKEKLVEETKNKLARYKDHPIIRDIVQKFPDIGMPLDIVLAWIGQKVGEQRIVEYMINIFEELARFNKIK
jgi:hypothetical protein